MVSRILGQEEKTKKFPRSNSRNLPPQDSVHAPARLQNGVRRPDTVPIHDTHHQDTVLTPEGVPLRDNVPPYDDGHHHLLYIDVTIDQQSMMIDIVIIMMLVHHRVDTSVTFKVNIVITTIGSMGLVTPLIPPARTITAILL